MRSTCNVIGSAERLRRGPERGTLGLEGRAVRPELAPAAQRARPRCEALLAADLVDAAGGEVAQLLALRRRAGRAADLVGHEVVPHQPDLAPLAKLVAHPELVETELAIAIELVLRRHPPPRLEVVDLERAVLGPHQAVDDATHRVAALGVELEADRSLEAERPVPVEGVVAPVVVL